MAEPRSILALDAAGAACSAAVWHDGALRAHRLETMARGHSERLLPMVAEVMAVAELSYAEVDLVAVTCGPGGFTGVRIGLAAAKGLALACGCPLSGISSFQAHAAAVDAAERRGKRLFVVLESKRRELYGQLFDDTLRPDGQPMIAPAETLLAGLPAETPLLLAGNAAEKCLQGAGAPSAQSIALAGSGHHAEARWVAQFLAQNETLGDGGAPRPIYLRDPDVTLPGRGSAA